MCEDAVSHQQRLDVTWRVEGSIPCEKNPHHPSRAACRALSLVTFDAARGKNRDTTLSSVRVDVPHTNNLTERVGSVKKDSADGYLVREII